MNPHFAFVSKRRLCVKIHFSFSCFQDSAMWVSSCFLTWEYWAGLWPVSRLCFQILVEAPPCSALAFSGHSKKIVRHQIHRSWSRHHQIHRFRLGHSRTFSRIAFSKIAFLSSLWHGALLSVWKKEIAASVREGVTSQASFLSPFAEWHRISMAIKLSSSVCSS